MSQEKAREIIEKAGHCYAATAVEGQPRVRAMKFVVTDDFKLWASTVNVSGKVKEFQQNPKVELLWVTPDGTELRVEGRADLSGGVEKKRKLFELHPGMKNLFADEHDPKLVHVEVVPTNVRWKEAGFHEYEQVDL
jgi:uncharacterized pyridoxamine 5'-phosphate oxidase family protein